MLATVMGAMDRGFRVILATDALCSSSDPTHDALMKNNRSHFSKQIEVADMAEILDGWRGKELHS